MPSAPEEALLEACKAGEPAAFRQLYDRYSRQVASQLAYLVPTPDLEDALQEVFVEVFRSLRRFEGKSAFSTWLYRVAVHVAMKSRRKASRSRLDLVEELPEVEALGASPAELLFAQERLRRVEALLGQLSPKKRTVLVLHDLRGVDAHRIAELTGSNVLTVRTRLFYARREFEALAAGDVALGEYFLAPAPASASEET